MRLNELLFESIIHQVAFYLFEATKQTPPSEQNNNIVKAWAPKLKMTYDELHLVWDKAKKSVGSDDYAQIVERFKRMLTSLEKVTKTQLKAGGKATFDYKVRTQQSMTDLLDDKPPPKSANKAFVKRVKDKISALNVKIKEIKEKPANTPLRKKRNMEQIKTLNQQKRDLRASIT